MTRNVSALWLANPFFVLEVGPGATRMDIERAGQRLLGLLALGSEAAQRYDTPLGPARRTTDDVRRALEALRDPAVRVVHELMADVARGTPATPREAAATPWTASRPPAGWSPE